MLHTPRAGCAADGRCGNAGLQRFSHREIDVYCAVPEDRPVPAFVGSRVWEFSGKLEERPTVKLPRSLRVAIRFNGFYIFHPFEKPKLTS
jgi:hypothetical protein